MSGALLAGRHCGTCGATVFARHMELSRRTQRVEADAATGKPGKVIRELAEEMLLDWCDEGCWQHREPQVAHVFGFKAMWPHTTCRAYGRPVYRSLLHVMLNVHDIDGASTPWLFSA